MGLKLTTSPPEEPVTLAELKAHLRVDSTYEDDLIDALNAAAREWVEEHTHRQLVDAQYEWTLPCFPGAGRPHFIEGGQVWHEQGWPNASDSPLYLPRAPVRSVDSISYIDTDGQSQTFTAFQADLDRVTSPPVIVPDADETWPSTNTGRLSAVTITFTAGYEPGSGSPTDYGANVPSRFKAAIKLLATHWYENRSAVTRDADPSEVPLTVRNLLANLRVRFPA